MAPAKGSNLELCSSTIALGNSIAVHTLEYLSIAKHPRHGIKECAIEFLGASRALFPARAGLQRATVSFPTDIDQELKARFLQAKNAFVVFDQVVNKLLSGEKSSGFGKIGRALGSIFSESEVEKLRTTLAKARAALSVSALMFGSTVVDNKSDAAGGIGYTALAAILEVPDPTKGGTTPTTPVSIQESTLTALPPKKGPLPPTPTYPQSTDLYTPRVSSRNPPDVALDHRPTLAGTLSGGSHNTASFRSNVTSQSRSDRSSIAIDSLSDHTDITSILTLHQQMDQPNSHLSVGEQVPKTAIRLKVDPTKAPRWRPNKLMGHVPESSNTALAGAVQQKDHKMVEQLLDCGVTPQNGLLGAAIANHDLQTLQLLLAFGAAPSSPDAEGATPLHTATKHSFFEAAQLLVKYGAQPNTSAGQSGETPLAMSISMNKFNFAMLYLQYGTDEEQLNTPMGNGETSFTQAMNKTTSITLVEALLIYGSDPNQKNEHGETPLFKALNAKRHDLLTLLLDANADPNMPGPKILLWPAVHTNQLQMLETLLGMLIIASCINQTDTLNRTRS